jgi:hypothetical protein
VLNWLTEVVKPELADSPLGPAPRRRTRR